MLGPDVAAAYLCMLAMDSILGFVAAVEALTYARTSEKGHVSESAPPDPLTCAALVDATWRTVLPVLSRGLAAASAEALVLQLLKVRPRTPPGRCHSPTRCPRVYVSRTSNALSWAGVLLLHASLWRAGHGGAPGRLPVQPL